MQLVVLDEAQFVNNWRGKTHEAIKALAARCYILLGGTFFANKWWDIYGLI